MYESPAYRIEFYKTWICLHMKALWTKYLYERDKSNTQNYLKNYSVKNKANSNIYQRVKFTIKVVKEHIIIWTGFAKPPLWNTRTWHIQSTHILSHNQHLNWGHQDSICDYICKTRDFSSLQHKKGYPPDLKIWQLAYIRREPLGFTIKVGKLF